MANKTLNQLTELSSTGISGTNLVPVYDTNEAGGEKLKKLTFSNLKSQLTSMDPSSFGNWVLVREWNLSSDTLAASANTINWDGESHSEIRVIVNAAWGASNNPRILINNDNGNNYGSGGIAQDGTTISGSYNGSQDSLSLGTGDAGYHRVIMEGNLKNSGGPRLFHSHRGIYTSGNDDKMYQSYTRRWSNTSDDVTTLSLYSAGPVSGSIKLYRWQEVVPIELHSYELVKEYNLSSETLNDTIDWDGEADPDLYAIFVGYGAGGSSNTMIRPNGDTNSSNYTYGGLFQNGSTLTGASGNVSGISLGYLADSTQTNFSRTHMYLKNTGKPRLSIRHESNYLSGDTDQIYKGWSTWWNNTADDVTSLTITTDDSISGNLRIYKLAKSHLFNQTIYSNKTLNVVASGGSDVTGDGTSQKPFASVNGALAWLKNKTINSDAIVTIQLADGHWTGQTTISPTHSDGDRIIIEGENYYDISLTSIQSSSGSAGAWSVVLNVSSVANIITGDYVLITQSTGGTRPETIEGCWEVTNVDSGNTRITVSSSNKYASAPTGAVSGSVRVIKSILTVATNTRAVQVDNGNTIRIGNLVFVGDQSDHGLFAYRGSQIGMNVNSDPIGVSNFSSGIYSHSNSTIQLGNYSCVSKCLYNGLFAAYGSAIIANNTSITGNGNQGVYARDVSCIYSGGSVFCGNSQNGIYSIYQSHIESGSCKSVYNTVHGANGNLNGNINVYNSTLTYNGNSGVQAGSKGMVNADSATITNNTSYGIYTFAYGFVSAIGATVSSNGTDLSPAANTQGNEYGYINT